MSHHFCHEKSQFWVKQTQTRTAVFSVRILLCKLITKPKPLEMAADVYNRGKHFKPFSSSLFQCVTGSGNKAHFSLCLTVLGTSKTKYKALYFLKYYVLKLKLSKATFGSRSPIHSAALSRRKVWRVWQNLPWIIKLFGNREESSESDLLLYKIVFMLNVWTFDIFRCCCLGRTNKSS